jgi:hypothetical protein
MVEIMYFKDDIKKVILFKAERTLWLNIDVTGEIKKDFQLKI